jgi:hypothetical protein
MDYHVILDPMVKDLYAVIEKHHGHPSFAAGKPSLHTMQDAVAAAAVIWACMMPKANQVRVSDRLDINRNTLRRYLSDNNFLFHAREQILVEGYDKYLLKQRMGLTK